MTSLLTINHYKESALVTIVGTYKNPAGARTDPTGGTVRYQYLGNKKPGQVGYLPPDVEGSATFAPASLPQNLVRRQLNIPAGVFEFDLDTTLKPGRWRYGWEGTGAVQNADEEEFMVDNRTLVGV